MTPIANGPARNTPKGRQTVRQDLTGCCCPNGPVTVGVFRNQQLVDVELLHLRRAGCFEPPGRIAPRVFQAGIGR